MSAPHRYLCWTDRLGLVVAIGCALHCATLTALFLSFPTLWLNRRYWEMGLWQKLFWLEWTLLGLAWLMLITAVLSSGFSRALGWPTGLGLAGLTGMSVLILTPLHFSSPWISAAIVACGLAVGLAHLLRLRGHLNATQT